MKRLTLALTVATAGALCGLAFAENPTSWGHVKNGAKEASPAAKPTISTAEGMYYSGGSTGWFGELKRQKNGVNLNFHFATGANPEDAVHGHLYTVWMFIFDDPSLCQDPDACNIFIDDLGPAFDGDPSTIPAATAIIGPVAGGQAGANGVNFNGHVKKDQPYDEFFGTLTDPNAQIGILVQDHGPAVQGLVSAMMQHNSAGCNNFLDIGLPLNPDHVGPNTCTDPVYLHFND